MVDIYLGIIAVMTLSVVGFRWVLHKAESASPASLHGWAGLTVAAIVAWLLLLRDRLILASLLPVPNLVVVGNWLPVAVAILMAIAWRLIPGGSIRKSATLVPLAALCLYYSYAAVLSPPPPCKDWWQKGVCIQTTSATCGPAAAATLLQMNGIQTSEAQMSRLCLTTHVGTSRHGLYRGLKHKTAGTPYDVRVIEGHEALTRSAQQRVPVLLFVGVPRLAGRIDPRYSGTWGWERGTSHVVVLLGCGVGDVLHIADPSIGRDDWHESILDVLWMHEGMCLEPRGK